MQIRPSTNTTFLLTIFFGLVPLVCASLILKPLVCLLLPCGFKISVFEFLGFLLITLRCVFDIQRRDSQHRKLESVLFCWRQKTLEVNEDGTVIVFD